MLGHVVESLIDFFPRNPATVSNHDGPVFRIGMLNRGSLDCSRLVALPKLAPIAPILVAKRHRDSFKKLNPLSGLVSQESQCARLGILDAHPLAVDPKFKNRPA